MAKITHSTRADYLRQPWKNGGGTTTEIARDEHHDRWLWRLSIADVDRSGPFSDFTGYWRTIVLLAGRGMRLTFDGAPPVVVDHRFEPFSFDGGWRTECDLLDGPIRDMNLIVDASRVEASLDVRVLGTTVSAWRTKAGDSALLHAIAGRFDIALDAHCIALAPGDTLRIDDAAVSTVSAMAREANGVLASAVIARRRSSTGVQAAPGGELQYIEPMPFDRWRCR